MLIRALDLKSVTALSHHTMFPLCVPMICADVSQEGVARHNDPMLTILSPATKKALVASPLR